VTVDPFAWNDDLHISCPLGLVVRGSTIDPETNVIAISVEIPAT